MICRPKWIFYYFFLWVKWSICLLKQFTAKPKRSFQSKASILAKGKPNRVSGWTIWSRKWHQIMFDDVQILWSLCSSTFKMVKKESCSWRYNILKVIHFYLIILVLCCLLMSKTNSACKNVYTALLTKQHTATASDKEAFVTRLWICKLNQGNGHSRECFLSSPILEWQIPFILNY